MNAASAQIPKLGTLRSELERLSRPPTAIEKAVAGLQSFPVTSSSVCEGDLHIGIFFDGTGNNKKEDYGTDDNPKYFLDRKHSNVVRLYNVFPDEVLPYRKENKPKDDKNQFYRIYVPGVGTPFPEIGEKGKSILGDAAGSGGEPRLLWAMIQVLNSVYRFYSPNKTLISDTEALSLIEGMAYQSTEKKSWFSRICRMTPLGAAENLGDLYNLVFTDNKKRVKTFTDLINNRLVLPDIKPGLRKIYIYPFGFSRGAAEARAFCNWMIEALRAASPYTTGVTLKNRQVIFPFLGIFDTVASVGVADAVSLTEGHATWGHNTQEIPDEVKKCVHMVAAHEIRACFPLDSVRKGDGKYHGDREEIVYPGAHSDIGGGYAFKQLGVSDFDSKPSSHDPENFRTADLQISRVTGFDMYLRARESKVPFYTIEQLAAQGRKEVATDLLPTVQTIEAIERYIRLSDIGELPVEEQLERHTSLYLYWRWCEGASWYPKDFDERQDAEIRAIGDEIDNRCKELLALDYKKQDFPAEFSEQDQQRQDQLREEVDALDKNRLAKTERKSTTHLDGLRRTQKEFMTVVAAYCNEIDRRTKEIDGMMKRRHEGGLSTEQPDCSPLDNPHSFAYKAQKAAMAVATHYIGKAIGAMYAGGEYLVKFVKVSNKARKALEKSMENEDVYSIAANVLEKREKWLAYLAFVGIAEERDTFAPEREGMLLLNGLAFGNSDKYKKSQEIFSQFFIDNVHDSMAGFPVPEFLINGYGIGKFRRIFYGNTGDQFTAERVKKENQDRRYGKRYHRYRGGMYIYDSDKEMEEYLKENLSA